MSDVKSQSATKNRRRKKLIRLDLQLKIVFITLFVASLVLLINFQLTLSGLWSISSQLNENTNVNQLLESIKISTIRKFLFSVAMAVPLAGFVGILYSFKFCGPIYKFKKYFTELSTGRWDDRCMLRQGDDLQDVAQSINEGIETLRDRIREDHEILSDVRTFLSNAVFTLDNESQELLAKIRERIDAEQKCFDERFPAGNVAKHEPEPAQQAEAPVTTAAANTSDAVAESEDSSNVDSTPEVAQADCDPVCEDAETEHEKDAELEGQV
jgi:methyl-accepting chemotaxis protein